jgi:hypothetical protein
VLICAFLRENKEKSVVQYTIREKQIQQRNSSLFPAAIPVRRRRRRFWSKTGLHMIIAAGAH